MIKKALLSILKLFKTFLLHLNIIKNIRKTKKTNLLVTKDKIWFSSEELHEVKMLPYFL